MKNRHNDFPSSGTDCRGTSQRKVAPQLMLKVDIISWPGLVVSYHLLDMLKSQTRLKYSKQIALVRDTLTASSVPQMSETTLSPLFPALFFSERLQGVFRPGVARVAAAQLAAQLWVMARPEAHEVCRPLHGALVGRE